ncbi:MAG: hypothetical protein ACYC2T_07195 [Bacillota bacterium]
MIEATLEIHFPQKDEVSLLLETKCSAGQEEFTQRLLLSFMAHRHMVSMGTCLLAGEIANMLYCATPEEFKEMAKSEEYKGIRFVPYDQPARRHLKASLRYSEDQVLEFMYKSHKMGINPKSVGKFSTMSLVALIRHYVENRCSDSAYLAALTDTCKITGAIFLKGALYESNIKEASVMAASQTMESLLDCAQAK